MWYIYNYMWRRNAPVGAAQVSIYGRWVANQNAEHWRIYQFTQVG